jgi:drug/metabolite transporter (DMT)-like permease
MALAPPIAALTTAILLPEDHMTARGWLGMAVTLGGIVWVITERVVQNETAKQIRRATVFGVVLGLIGAAGQGVGAVVAKMGTNSFNHPFAATQIRAIAGVVGFFLLILITRDLRRCWLAMRDWRAFLALTFGAIAGPLLGVSMLLKSMTMGVTPGEASTLAALVPIFILPILIVRGKEHVTWRASLGAIVAVVGVAILMWRQ